MVRVCKKYIKNLLTHEGERPDKISWKPPLWKKSQ